MQPPHSPVPSPERSPAPPLEVLLDDQSRRWQEGDRFLVDAYLKTYPDLAGDAQRLLELIEHEIALRQARGETPQLDEYLRRFPNIAGPLRERFEQYLAHGLDAQPPYVPDEDRLLAALPSRDAVPVAAPARPQIESAAALVAAVGQSPLLTPAQLKEVTQQLQPRCADARSLARELLQRGWLTPYQVNQLFQGKGARLVLGQYVLLERLGEGGMGQVFKARHQLLDRIVALKVIRPEQLADGNAVRRFHREVRAAAQLSHPNVVHAFDADQVGATHLLVMEFVEGSDLHALVKKNGPLPVAVACEYIRQAALGLQHAHEHGLVHRDIKPSNLLVASGGRKPPEDAPETFGASSGGLRPPLAGGVVKLLDLGLARLKEPGSDGESSATLTNSAAVMGTPDYIAPEQARESHRVDIRADLYSLGCTLYFLLTGRPPFGGGSLGEKLIKHQLDEPEPVEKLRPEVPPGVAGVLRKLMAKRPEDRYQTPAELAAVLAEGLRMGNWPAASRDGGEAVPAAIPISRGSAGGDGPSGSGAGLSSRMEPPTQPRLHAPWRQRQAAARRRWLLLNGLGALVLLAVAVGVVFLLLRPGSNPTEPVPPTSPVTEEERAQQALRPLQAQAADPAADRDKLGQELMGFRMAHAGTRAAWEAGVLLRELPSPLDGLRRDELPEWERPPWQPSEVVQVLGDHRGRHWNHVQAVALSPDGKLAAGSDGLDIVLWDTATMRERLRWRAHDNELRALCFADGGRGLVSAAHNEAAVCRWEISAGKLMRQVQTKTAVSWLSADGKRGLGGDRKKVALYELENGKELQHFEGHTDQVLAGALATDGKRALTGGKDKMVRLWDTATGKELACLKGHTTEVMGVALMPDGKHALSSGRDERIRYWDLETSKQIWEVPAHPHGSRLTVAPDGKRALASDAAGVVGIVHVLNLDTGKDVRRLENLHVTAAAFSPDSRLTVTGGRDGQVRLWDLQTGQQLHPSDGPSAAVMQVFLTPDGRQAVTSFWDPRTAWLWDVVTGKQFGRVKEEVQHLGIALSPDGQRLLGGSYANLYLWEVPSGKTRATWKFPCSIDSLAFSPDGQQALLGTHTQSQQGGQLQYADFNVRLIDLRSGKELKSLPGHTDFIRSVAFSPDGRLGLSGAGSAGVPSDYVLRLWDLQTGKLLRTLAGHTHQVTGVAYSPAGRRAASCSHDGTVRLWELEGARWNEPLVLQHNQGAVDWVDTVAFAPDGQTLASASSRGRVVVWDLSGKRRKEWQLPGPVNGLSFATDGRHLATAHSNGTVYIFRLAPAPARP